MSGLAERWIAKSYTTSRTNRTNRSRNWVEVKKTISVIVPQWQEYFCHACKNFRGYRNDCPVILEDCLLTKVLDAIENEGDANSKAKTLEGLEIGQGITADMVSALWVESGDELALLFDNPLWFICMAEHLSSHPEGTIGMGL